MDTLTKNKDQYMTVSYYKDGHNKVKSEIKILDLNSYDEIVLKWFDRKVRKIAETGLKYIVFLNKKEDVIHWYED